MAPTPKSTKKKALIVNEPKQIATPPIAKRKTARKCVNNHQKKSVETTRKAVEATVEAVISTLGRQQQQRGDSIVNTSSSSSSSSNNNNYELDSSTITIAGLLRNRQKSSPLTDADANDPEMNAINNVVDDDVDDDGEDMKRCQTEHQRQPLKQFLVTALSIVRQRSLEYLKGKEPYRTELHIEHALMQRGCALNLKFVHGVEKPDGSIDVYAFCSAMQEVNITLDVVNAHKKATYKTFADFRANAFNIYKITFPKESNQWKNAICSCPAFDADFICKHIISIAYSLGLIVDGAQVEEDYDDEPLFQLGRGRPKRTSKALVLE